MTADNKMLHVRELKDAHLRLLIKMMRDRRDQRQVQMEDAESDSLTYAHDARVLEGLFHHHEELEKQFKEATEWLDVFEEEKSRRNMVDTIVEVEW